MMNLSKHKPGLVEKPPPRFKKSTEMECEFKISVDHKLEDVIQAAMDLGCDQPTGTSSGDGMMIIEVRGARADEWLETYCRIIDKDLETFRSLQVW